MEQEEEEEEREEFSSPEASQDLAEGEGLRCQAPPLRQGPPSNRQTDRPALHYSSSCFRSVRVKDIL